MRQLQNWRGPASSFDYAVVFGPASSFDCAVVFGQASSFDCAVVFGQASSFDYAVTFEKLHSMAHSRATGWVSRSESRGESARRCRWEASRSRVR